MKKKKWIKGERPECTAIYNYFTESLVPKLCSRPCFVFCILEGVGGGEGMQLLLVIGSDSDNDGGKNVVNKCVCFLCPDYFKFTYVYFVKCKWIPLELNNS